MSRCCSLARALTRIATTATTTMPSSTLKAVSTTVRGVGVGDRPSRACAARSGGSRRPSRSPGARRWLPGRDARQRRLGERRRRGRLVEPDRLRPVPAARGRARPASSVSRVTQAAPGWRGGSWPGWTGWPCRHRELDRAVSAVSPPGPSLRRGCPSARRSSVPGRSPPSEAPTRRSTPARRPLAAPSRPDTSSTRPPSRQRPRS